MHFNADLPDSEAMEIRNYLNASRIATIRPQWDARCCEPGTVCLAKTEISRHLGVPDSMQPIQSEEIMLSDLHNALPSLSHLSHCFFVFEMMHPERFSISRTAKVEWFPQCAASYLTFQISQIFTDKGAYRLQFLSERD
jgi:hypothetical protein